MDNQLIFIIVIVVTFILISKFLPIEKFNSIQDDKCTLEYKFQYPLNIKYPSNTIDCDIYNNKNDCDKGYQCVWIEDKLKEYPLNTPFCTGNIFAVPT